MKPHQIYESMMMEVKFRLKVIDEYLKISSNQLVPLYIEICFLQIRKVIELVCFACILCDEKRYKEFRELEGLTSEKDHSDYTKDWNSEIILKTLNDVSPHFMPIPLGQLSSINGKYHYDRADVNTTHKKLIKMYKKCGGFLHIPRPFGENYELYISGQIQKNKSATQNIIAYVRYLKDLLWKHAAIGLEYEERGDPLEPANPQNAWIVDFEDYDTQKVSITVGKAE